MSDDWKHDINTIHLNMTMPQARAALIEYFSQPDAVIARSHSGNCQYQNSEGAKCAVGCVLPEYHFDLEGNDLVGLLEMGYLNIRYKSTRRFLAYMQIQHDSTDSTPAQVVAAARAYTPALAESRLRDSGIL